MTDVTGDQLALPAPPGRLAQRWNHVRELGTRGWNHVYATGRKWKLGRTAPAAYGALALALGIGGVIGHTIGHGLTPWIFLVITGAFALRLDSRIR